MLGKETDTLMHDLKHAMTIIMANAEILGGEDLTPELRQEWLQTLITMSEWIVLKEAKANNREQVCRILLVEKTDRLYRNLKDYVTLDPDELDIEIHFVKENFVLTKDSRSMEKFMHGIKVLMAKDYIDNLSEESKKGMLEKAEQGIWPTVAPLGYRNVEVNGKRVIIRTRIPLILMRA